MVLVKIQHITLYGLKNIEILKIFLTVEIFKALFKELSQ